MKKTLGVLFVMVASILLIGVASAKNVQKVKCEDFVVQMSESSDAYLMSWSDQSAQAKKLNVDFFVNDLEELHDSLDNDATQYLIPKLPEYVGANLHFVVRTIPGGVVAGSCTGEKSWVGEEYIETLTWREIETATPVPTSYRTLAGYDDVRDEMILVTGDCNTWIFDGTDWMLRDTVHRPNFCRGAAGAFDSERGVFVIFGGAPMTSSVTSNETWEWDGVDWTQSLTSTTPPANIYQSMVYDPVRQEVMMFGGVINTASNTSTNQTWVYDGLNWSLKSVASAPAPRHFTAMAFDVDRSEVVLFGGWNGSSTLGDTWTWDGSNWTRKYPATNTRTVAGMNMAYDQRKGLVILFGGTYCCSSSGPFAETWAWDGATWTRLYPEVSPPARSHFGMFFSPVLQRIIGFGGVHEYNGSVVYEKTWELLIP